MSFFTVSHWEAKTWNKEDEAKASEKYIPMILSMGATSVKMCKTDELKFMVITEWSSGEIAKEAAEKIASVRAQASEEFDNVMISSHAGEAFASG
tara:strand:+ start:524 stop:808 length:285 start_codon:yes stop_codon:yes gene_type:complete